MFHLLSGTGKSSKVWQVVRAAQYLKSRDRGFPCNLIPDCFFNSLFLPLGVERCTRKRRKLSGAVWRFPRKLRAAESEGLGRTLAFYRSLLEESRSNRWMTGTQILHFREWAPAATKAHRPRLKRCIRFIIKPAV